MKDLIMNLVDTYAQEVKDFGYVDDSVPRKTIAEAIERLTAERDAAKQCVSNLLARIHRDGGHYEAEHGVDKAVRDADRLVAEIYAERDAMKETK